LKRLARHHDVVLVHDPELLVAAAGLRLRNLVWDVHEDPSAALQVKEWVPKSLRAVAAALWRGAERQAERSYELLLAEFAYQERFQRRHPVVPSFLLTEPMQCTPQPRGRWTLDDRRTRLTGSAAAEPGAQAPTEQLLSFIRRYVGRG